MIIQTFAGNHFQKKKNSSGHFQLLPLAIHWPSDYPLSILLQIEKNPFEKIKMY